jgi:hypothetical protein
MSDTQTIPTTAEDSYRYARLVVKGRWPEAESVIAKDPYYAYVYALHVIKGRWPEAESVIAADPVWHGRYREFLTSLGATR